MLACECVLKLLGWNLTDCDGVYGQYTITGMCSVDSVRCVHLELRRATPDLGASVVPVCTRWVPVLGRAAAHA